MLFSSTIEARKDLSKENSGPSYEGDERCSFCGRISTKKKDQRAGNTSGFTKALGGHHPIKKRREAGRKTAIVLLVVQRVIQGLEQHMFVFLELTTA